jgi:cobalt-zinc-cadmium efflux system outer membrane protein
MRFGFDAGVPVRAMCAIACALVSGQAFSAPLTLEEAFRIAEDANPAIRNARAAIHAAEGQLSESRAPLFNNPEVSLEHSRTRIPSGAAPGERFNAWTAGISQSFELGGQQGQRRLAAEAETAAIAANIAETRATLRAEVEQRFVQVLALQLRAAIEQGTVSLVEQASAAMTKRLNEGEVSRLDANLARVEAERARNQLVQLDEQLMQARAELAGLLQLPPGELPEARGELRRDAAYTLDDLLQSTPRRRQLEALAKREEAARRRLALERASRYPDVTVGLFTGRDGPPEMRENIVGLSVSVPIPLFRRNEAGVGRALTELTQTQVERQAAERDAGAAVRTQWQRLARLQARASLLRESVLMMLEDNQRLSQRALSEGEIGVAELLLVNRQVAETRRELLEADTELRLARIALERAAGWPPLDSKESR